MRGASRGGMRGSPAHVGGGQKAWGLGAAERLEREVADSGTRLDTAGQRGRFRMHRFLPFGLADRAGTATLEPL